MGKVASCPTSELDIIHTLLEFRQTRECVTLDLDGEHAAGLEVELSKGQTLCGVFFMLFVCSDCI